MWLKSERGEIEVYLCPEDDGAAADAVSSADEGKGESVSAGSTFDCKSALEAATRTPRKQAPASTAVAVAVAAKVRPDDSEALKFAFISEDDDLGTIGSTKSYLLMSEGERTVRAPVAASAAAAMTATANSSPPGALPFLSLEPPLSEEDYNFALEASEGITDLFDEDLLLTSS